MPSADPVRSGATSTFTPNPAAIQSLPCSMPVSIRMPAELCLAQPAHRSAISASACAASTPSRLRSVDHRQPRRKSTPAPPRPERRVMAAAPSRRDCRAATTIAGPAGPGPRSAPPSPASTGRCRRPTRGGALPRWLNRSRRTGLTGQALEKISSVIALAAGRARGRVQQELDRDGQHREDQDRVIATRRRNRHVRLVQRLARQAS